MLSPLPLPVEERKGSRGKVRSQCRQPARARLRKTAGGQVRNLPLLVRPVGRLETCPSWCGVGRLETCPSWCGVGRLETCPYRCGNGRGRGGGRCYPPLPLPVEERKGSREKVKADADNPHAPVYARRPVGRLGTCPYWYGRGAGWKPAPTGTGWAGWKPAPTGTGWAGWKPAPTGTAGGQVGNPPLLVRPGGRLETCPSWCGNGREGEGGRGKVRATRRAPQHRH
jgi:hypothetical protein